MIGVNVRWVYLAPQNIPREIVLTLGNKVILYMILYKLESIQRKAVQFVLKRCHNAFSVSSIMDRLNWPILQQRWRTARPTMLWKRKNNLVHIEVLKTLPEDYWAIQAGLLTPLTFARHRLSPLAAITSGAYFLPTGGWWQWICACVHISNILCVCVCVLVCPKLFTTGISKIIKELQYNITLLSIHWLHEEWFVVPSTLITHSLQS